MTEEAPITSKEDYEFPNQIFSQLEDYDFGSEVYDRTRQELYGLLKRETDLPEGRVEEINHFLSEGKVELAKEVLE